MVAGGAFKRKDDGSVEVWLDGWHVRFPADGSKPSASKSAAPDPLPTSEETGVTVRSFGDAIYISHGAWIVGLRESDFTVTPSEPEEDDGDRRYYYEMR
jgi:hypothetical protein